jgi:tetratricopeptide (TPR) repeat protein
MSMPRLFALLLVLFCTTPTFAQSSDDPDRSEALEALGSRDDAQRAKAVVWIANHGKPADDEILLQHLTDESPLVRNFAEQGLWLLWSRSGDEKIDALLAKGVQEMQTRQFKASIATFSEVIRRKPGFAEGWNKRATVLYMAGDYRASLADCDEVLKRNPYHFGALAGYGQIYFQLEQYSKAIDYWKRALRVNPNMGGVEKSIKGTEELLAEKRKRST